MYHAKALGKSRHQVFDSSMHARARKLLQLEHDLRRAIDRREFRVHYQPIVRVEDRRIAGFEALVRWQHPQRGLVAPSEFIPLAEETGLVVPLGRSVLEEACRQGAEWRRAGGDDLTVSVNLSVKQFTQPDLVEQVDAVLRDPACPRGCSSSRSRRAWSWRTRTPPSRCCAACKALGVHIAIDDFGTGYSSLSYLLRLPADSLKIDRSFVSGSGDPGRNANIVRTVVGLAYSLGLDVVAEGVETEEQRALLEDLGCPLAQGFLFSPAVDGPAATRLLAAAAPALGGEPVPEWGSRLALRPMPRPIVQVTAPGQSCVRFTFGQVAHDRLDRVKALLCRPSHSVLSVLRRIGTGARLVADVLSGETAGMCHRLPRAVPLSRP